jgi:hypothetical protein
MARQEVVQIRCDRCKRVELIPPGPKSSEPVLLLKFKNVTVTYEDTCPRCDQAIERIIRSLEEWERELNQHFGPTAQIPGVQPPLTVAPNFSPPQPHAPSNAPVIPAVAGGKR